MRKPTHASKKPRSAASYWKHPQRKRKRISFKRLVDVTAFRLEELGYEQRPQILGPQAIVNARVPWHE